MGLNKKKLESCYVPLILMFNLFVCSIGYCQSMSEVAAQPESLGKVDPEIGASMIKLWPGVRLLLIDRLFKFSYSVERFLSSSIVVLGNVAPVGFLFDNEMSR